MAKTIPQHRPRFDILVASSEGVADRWLSQYKDSQSPDKIAISSKLEKLGDKLTVEQADSIIGNQSWTHPYCHSCGEYKLKGVQFGEDPFLNVCLDCLKKAEMALTSTNRTPET